MGRKAERSDKDIKQYCDYCAEASPHGDGYCFCNEKKIIISEEKGRKQNHCRHFRFTEMSVFDPGRVYKPHKMSADDGNQVSMF